MQNRRRTGNEKKEYPVKYSRIDNEELMRLFIEYEKRLKVIRDKLVSLDMPEGEGDLTEELRIQVKSRYGFKRNRMRFLRCEKLASELELKLLGTGTRPDRCLRHAISQAFAASRPQVLLQS